MKRYYVSQSSWFDTHPYNVDEIKLAVKNCGGKNVRTSNCFGWSNQPKVVTFGLDSNDDQNAETYKNILKTLQKSIGTNWIILSEKDW